MVENKLLVPMVTRLKFLLYDLFRCLFFRSDNSVNRRIHSLLNIKSPSPTTKLITASARVSTSDVSIDPSRKLFFRLFVPTATNTPANKPLPFILYFHGGGFSAWGPDSFFFDGLCSRLAAEIPAVIASVNYRHAPEHRYPSQYEDGFDALKFINSQNYTILPAYTDLNNCFIAGDSSGANIAHHVTARACKNSHEFDKLKIVGIVLLQPFFGGEERTESELRLKDTPMLSVDQADQLWRLFLPEGADRNHHAANVLNSAKLKNVNFPRALVVVGGHDVLQDWQRRYVEWLKNDGKQVDLIEYPNAFHSFYAFPEVQDYEMLIDDLRKFILKQAAQLS